MPRKNSVQMRSERKEEKNKEAAAARAYSCSTNLLVGITFESCGGVS